MKIPLYMKELKQYSLFQSYYTREPCSGTGLLYGCQDLDTEVILEDHYNPGSSMHNEFSGSGGRGGRGEDNIRNPL